MHRAVCVLLLAVFAGCSAGGPPAHREDRTARLEASPPASAPPAPSQAAEPTPSAPSPEPSPEPDPFARARALEVSDPPVLADRLAAAEAAIRSPAVPMSALGPHGRVQQAAYRQLVTRPEWRPLVAERLPEGLRPVAVANVEAGAELRALVRPGTALPSWRILAPPPAEDLLRFYREAEGELEVPWQYLAAIHLVESRMGRIRGTSSAGARGPMQFLPSTWSRYGRGDIDDPRDAILAAARYLRANGAPGEMAGALYAYNRSRRYVRAVTLYAGIMQEDERAFLGYYHWQVYYMTTAGDALLEEGYGG